MARLRLGLSGLLLLVLAAIGFDLGGAPDAGVDAAWSQAGEAQLDASRSGPGIATSASSVSADDSDDDPDRAEAAASGAGPRSAATIGASGRTTTRRPLRPRATGPPASSIA